jgi:hypothetical protein
MRILIEAQMPHKPFNAAVADGTVGQKLQRILAEQKPEAVYFTEIDGRRTCVLIVNATDASQIPSFAEPWFLLFEADVKFRPVMTPEDLGRAGLDAIGKKWA